MTTEQLYKELNYVSHSREKRLQYAHLILENPELTPRLLEIIFMVDDKLSPRAGWVLEFACTKDLEAIIPYLDIFTEQFHKVHLDSAVRPVAKICQLIAKAYYSKNDSVIKNALTPIHKERIIETCFDYLIHDEKVATKAYGMTTLFLLGKEYGWIHSELMIILERDFQTQSAAFKARARYILKKIKK